MSGGDTSGDLSQVLRIDLYNFEEPQFENSKYVLTSPRSLEACANLGVKPLDLLYKPLAEFQEELLPKDVPLRTVYNIYAEHEEDRQKKLHLCRDERRKIIENEANSTGGRSSLRKYGDGIFKSSTAPQGKVVDKASLQRKRTAWTTSIGHRRVTPDELNQRASELHAESQKLRRELLSKSDRVSSATRKGGRQRTRKARPSSGRRCKSADSRSGSGAGALSRSKSGSATSLVPKVTHLPARDQKIIELMKTKREREQAELEAKEVAHRAWHQQQQKEEAARVATEMERRKLLAELDRQKSLRRSASRERLDKSESWLSEKHKSMDLDSTQDWESSYLKQLKIKNLKVLEHREKDHKRKVNQEFNRTKLEEDMENMKNLVNDQQRHDQEKAAIRKSISLHEESTRTLLKNKKEREAFETRKKLLDSMTDQELEDTRRLVEGRLNKAADNHTHIVQTRNHNIFLSRREQAKRQDHARKSLELQEKQLDAWRHSLVEHRKKLEDQAQRTASMTVLQKARQAQEERLAREKEHSENIKKVQQELDAWRMETAESIEVKDRRSQAVQDMKDMTYHQSRATAQASQMLRDEIRHRYDTQTFDKMALQAELYAKIDRKGLFQNLSQKV